MTRGVLALIPVVMMLVMTAEDWRDGKAKDRAKAVLKLLGGPFCREDGSVC